MGFRISQLIHVAAKLGIADVLKDGPQSCDDLAKAVRAQPRALYRLLRTLASLEIFAEDAEGRFALTPLAASLQTDVPDSVRSMAIMAGEDWSWRPYGALLQTIQTGETAFAHVFGTGLYSYLAQHAEASESFYARMMASTKPSAAAVLDAYDFSGLHTIVDVGGGHGALITAILQAHPDMQGMLFDLPHVLEGARAVIEAERVADRCVLVAGSYLEAVPSGGDAYVLKSIMEDVDDERATRILQNCRQAMAGSGRLLVVDWVLPPSNAPSRVQFTDLAMLVMTGGAVRTEAEFQRLFESAGFRLSHMVPTASHQSILEGVPV
jgi:hypothetical protein